LLKSNWEIIEVPGGQIGFQEVFGQFYVGSLAALPEALPALLIKVRAIARRRGYNRIFWQMHAFEGFRVMRFIANPKSRIERVDGCFDGPTRFIVRSITASTRI